MKRCPAKPDDFFHRQQRLVLVSLLDHGNPLSSLSGWQML